MGILIAIGLCAFILSITIGALMEHRAWEAFYVMAIIGTIIAIVVCVANHLLSPRTWLIIVLSYPFLSAIHLALRWYLFLRDFAQELEEPLQNFKERHHISGRTLSRNDQREFGYTDEARHLDNKYGHLPPTAKYASDRIVAWLIFWPYSVIWLLTARPVKWLITVGERMVHLVSILLREKTATAAVKELQ